MRIEHRDDDDAEGHGFRGLGERALVDDAGVEVRMWEPLSFRGRTWFYCCIRDHRLTGERFVDLRPDPSHRQPWIAVLERDLADLARASHPPRSGLSR